MQERWRMNKLGFVNFWDWEEFPFSEGRLLLRGENGAGKSVTTQSFIPFMLDGDLRPYRLDSFGSKDRKMYYYLLGEDKEESTGYLYLEFIKPEHRLYRTLVVGLRARRSSSQGLPAYFPHPAGGPQPVRRWGKLGGTGQRLQTDGQPDAFRLCRDGTVRQAAPPFDPAAQTQAKQGLFPSSSAGDPERLAAAVERGGHCPHGQLHGKDGYHPASAGSAGAELAGGDSTIWRPVSLPSSVRPK